MFRVYTSSARTAADSFGRVYRTVNTRVAGQPSWVVKAAVVAGVVVFVAVVALLVVPALVIGAVVLLLLGGIWAIRERVARWLGRGGGAPGGLRDPRRNVRVIERREG
jgi:tetrahydromethanopterin S-methyltransferase subunit E